jgi:hypothetical protein
MVSSLVPSPILTTGHLSLLALFVCGSAQSEGWRLGIEYELEKDRRTGIRNHAVTAKPGWEFAKDSPVNLVELLIDRNEDATADDDGVRAKETKLFLRVRHNRNLTAHISYYIRGGVGRSFNNQRDFMYGYVEPGLKYELTERWEWTFAVRFINALDGMDGQRVRKYITGPSFALTPRDEVEFRYVRGSGDKDVWSWAVGYVRRF